MQDSGVEVTTYCLFAPWTASTTSDPVFKGFGEQWIHSKGGRLNLPFKNLKVGIALYEDISTLSRVLEEEKPNRIEYRAAISFAASTSHFVNCTFGYCLARLSYTKPRL